MTDVLTHVPDEDRQLVDIDTALVLEQTLDVRPFEGDWDDYPHEDER